MITTRTYNRIMAGRGSMYADLCHAEGFVGADWFENTDFTGRFPDRWQEFNREYRDRYLEVYLGSSRIGAGLACGMLHRLCKGIAVGDVVLCPTGKGSYMVGEIKSDYIFAPGNSLPHRRLVSWYPQRIDRSDMSTALRNSAGSAGTICDLSQYADEINRLLGTTPALAILAAGELIEDPAAFALERHLQDFLVHNWSATELGKQYDIFTDAGEIVGREYPCDTGRIDILALRKDQKEILVVELKKGQASDAVVGQILRYMGYVQDELAEPGQTVRGVIIALEDDLRIRRALKMAPAVQFYRYEVSFRLIPG